MNGLPHVERGYYRDGVEVVRLFCFQENLHSPSSSCALSDKHVDGGLEGLVRKKGKYELNLVSVSLDFVLEGLDFEPFQDVGLLLVLDLKLVVEFLVAINVFQSCDFVVEVLFDLHSTLSFEMDFLGLSLRLSHSKERVDPIDFLVEFDEHSSLITLNDGGLEADCELEDALGRNHHIFLLVHQNLEDGNLLILFQDDLHCDFGREGVFEGNGLGLVFIDYRGNNDLVEVGWRNSDSKDHELPGAQFFRLELNQFSLLFVQLAWHVGDRDVLLLLGLEQKIRMTDLKVAFL